MLKIIIESDSFKIQESFDITGVKTLTLNANDEKLIDLSIIIGGKGIKNNKKENNNPNIIENLKKNLKKEDRPWSPSGK